MAPLELSITELFDSCEAAFPTSMRPDSWYLVVASALVTASNPYYLGNLYTYLVNDPTWCEPEQRRMVNRRIREFLMKQWVTVGVPKTAVGLFSLLQVERPQDVDLSMTKKYTVLDKMNHQRGTDFLVAVYGEERAASMFTKWGSDMEWLTKDIVYGLFYADDGVLDNLETELITYTAIACQGLHVPLVNHVRGLKRMGLKLEEIEGITSCAKSVARWAGQDTSGWRSPRDVISWD